MTTENRLRMSELAGLTEERLNIAVTERTALQRSVIDAMNYSLSAGGKRIRPVLLLEFCRICGGDTKKAADVAAAVEMMHTFSLIHDDLPCMDNDDLRRGKPSCHKAYGEACALLAGDALAIYPFELISAAPLAADTRLRLISELSHAVGAEGMIGGQIIDMELEGKNADEQLLRTLCSHKTGALIRAACRMGCICAGADEAKLAAAEAYADRIGLAFQVVDDILDIVGDESELGKPIGSDAEQEKRTFATLLGIDSARELAVRLTEEAKTALSVFDDADFLRELADMLIERNK